MRVLYSRRSRRDLEDIALFIARDNPHRALSFVDELEEACSGLSDRPLRFALMPQLEKLGLRRRPHDNYLILYRVVGDQVEIVRIVHAAADPETILNPF